MEALDKLLESPSLLGILASSVIVTFVLARTLAKVVEAYIAKKWSTPDPGSESPFQRIPACAVDQTRIRETHTMVEDLQRAVDRGQFACAWKDRDEVKDLIQAVLYNTKSIEHLTVEISQLTVELRKRNNGSGKG